MNLLRKAFYAATVLIGATSAARADIIIDDFGSPTPGITYAITGVAPDNLPNPTVFTTNNVQPGINRSVTLTVTSPLPPNADSLSGAIGNFGPSGSLFTMALNSFSSGSAVINYSFAAPMNLVPTGVSGSLQYLSSADSGFASSVPLNFVISTASGDLTFNTTMNLTAGFSPTNVPLSSFTGTGDLTQATGMSITIIGGQAADVALDAINITTPPPIDPVPAPPAALLALLALPALGLRKRWNKKEVAMA